MKTNRFSPFNSRGGSLVEMMIAIGITMIAVMATLAVQQSNLASQRQVRVTNIIQSEVARIRQLLLDPQAWDNTIQAGGAGNSLACLRTTTADCAAFAGVDTNIDVYDASNVLAYPSDSAPGQGFNEMGSPCVGFNTGAGNNNCPISYRISWRPLCPAAGVCANPSVTLNIQAIYNPRRGGITINTARFDTTGGLAGSPQPIVRSAANIQKTFRLAHYAAGAGGRCLPTGVARPLTKTQDPFSIVNSPALNATATVFRIREAGTYVCAVMGVAYGVGGFEVRLVNVATGATVGSGVGLAPANVQGSANFDVTFRIAAPTNFRVIQLCPSGDLANREMGYPVTGAITNVYATVACTQVD